MNKNIIANRYAQALFDHSNESNNLEKVAQDLNALENVITESDEFSAFLNHPAIDQNKRESILQELFSKKISTPTMNFLLFLEHKRRLYLLELVCGSFQRIYNNFNKIQNITITTSAPLSKSQIERIEEKWKKRLNKNIQSLVVLDANLLGGLRIQLNDEIYDYTIDNKLKRFKESILA